MKNNPVVGDLLRDLESLQNDIMKKSVSRGATDEQVKVWVKQVQEIVYDIEDWQLESEAAGTKSNFGESERAWQIDNFKSLIDEARNRCTRYDSLKEALTADADPVDAAHRHASSSKTEVNIDSPQLWGEKIVLVGVDDIKKDLLKNHLQDKKEILTVVSIVGPGGLGKTTLAKEIYKELKTQSDCQASVFLGRNPSMKATLLDLLRQLKPQKDHCDSRASWDERRVITELWEFLAQKRYLILIDDIQSTWAWKFINCALPDNDRGSRILVTTRIKDVAELCSICPSDVLYGMKALSLENSKDLLEKLISVPKRERPVHFEEVTDRFLKMCCGMPLAIVVTAGLLRKKFVFPPLDQNYSTSQWMRKILDISFADLSLHVKYCFLYMSGFPVNYTIEKDHLIRRWVSEGLIPKRDGKSLRETGESYFNELIAVRLIEPVFDYNDDQAVGCTVHGVIHDFIASLARDENFVTAAAELESGPFPCDTIRRFYVDYSRQEEEAGTLVSSAVHLSRVRYLTVFGEGTVPDLSAFKLLRVLDLKDTINISSYQVWKLTGSLSLLRYLALGRLTASSTSIKVEGLKHLETLDVSRTPHIRLSASIYRLPKLVSIIGGAVVLPAYDRRPKGMLNWEEVSTIIIGFDAQYNVVAELLVNSERLRMLGVRAKSSWYYKKHSTKIVPLFNGIKNCRLQCLHLDTDLDMPVGWTPSPTLQRFVLKKSVPRVPDDWKLLVNLTHLDILIYEVEAQDLSVLGKLPKLIFLKIYSEGYDPNERVTIYDGFRSLKVAWFKCPDGGMSLQFDYKPLQQLRRLRLDFHAGKTRKLCGSAFDFGIRFPSRLIEVYVTINCKGSAPTDVLSAENAIKEQVYDHPNKPSWQLIRQHANTADASSSSQGSTLATQASSSTPNKPISQPSYCLC